MQNSGKANQSKTTKKEIQSLIKLDKMIFILLQNCDACLPNNGARLKMCDLVHSITLWFILWEFELINFSYIVTFCHLVITQTFTAHLLFVVPYMLLHFRMSAEWIVAVYVNFNKGLLDLKKVLDIEFRLSVFSVWDLQSNFNLFKSCIQWV